MDHFDYKHGELHAEDVALNAIAREVGTPFYCYSAATLTRHAMVFQQSLAALKPLVCFAVKANSNIAVLTLLGKAGLGADVVSGGEMRRALKAGIAADKIVFSGVGKTKAEMRDALEAGILQFNVESDRELLTLNEVAREMNQRAPIALRVNPDVDAGTHAKISTGKKENKFGIAMEVAPAIYALAASLPHIYVRGVSVHIGSQLTSLDPFRAAYTRVKALVANLKKAGIDLKSIDLGGGLGVPYANGDAPPSPDAYAAMVNEIFAGDEHQLIFEPGRLIAGNAGVLVSEVLYVKRTENTYVIIDAGMNDLMRPALYDSIHRCVPLKQSGETASPAQIVGPVCESSDVFEKNAQLAPLREGDLVAFRTAGAYGASMSNTYNSRPLIPEVLVSGERFAVIRKRPDYSEMLASEVIPSWV